MIRNFLIFVFCVFLIYGLSANENAIRTLRSINFNKTTSISGINHRFDMTINKSPYRILSPDEFFPNTSLQKFSGKVYNATPAAVKFVISELNIDNIQNEKRKIVVYSDRFSFFRKDFNKIIRDIRNEHIFDNYYVFKPVYRSFNLETDASATSGEEMKDVYKDFNTRYVMWELCKEFCIINPHDNLVYSIGYYTDVEDFAYEIPYLLNYFK